jgi:hypothetical protein
MLNQITRSLMIGAFLFTASACSSMHKSAAPTEAKPGVVVQFPQDWKVQQDGKTVADGPDGVAVVVMRIDKKSADDVRKAIPQSLAPVVQRIQIDDTDDTTVNGLKAQRVAGRGYRNEKPVRFSALLIPAKNATATDAVIAVGPETHYKRHMRELDGALDSVRAAQ